MLAEMAILELVPLIIIRLPFGHGQRVLKLNWNLNFLKFPTQNRRGTQSLDKGKSRGNAAQQSFTRSLASGQKKHKAVDTQRSAISCRKRQVKDAAKFNRHLVLL